MNQRIESTQRLGDGKGFCSRGYRFHVGKTVSKSSRQLTKKPRGVRAKPIRSEESDIELVEDAWPRFEALVKSAAKMGHKPHVGESPTRTARKHPKARNS